jgi:hypothetical protein
MGTNVSTCFIKTPPGKKEVLGIKLPFLVMIIKNVRAAFLPIQIFDIPEY